MRFNSLALLTTQVAVALCARSTHSSTANIVTDIADNYDFVIVGGGLAGLVIGGRLSEDANHTVLVLEAGEDGDDYRDQIDIPGYAYYKSLWDTPLDWQFRTVPQPNANNTECQWPRGKTLGGSSAINGLYLNRPGEIEINAWNDMLGDMDGADNWSWDSLFDAMKTSETFTPATAATAQEADITWNTASHGTNGPIQMSYPGYQFPMNGQFSTACENVGIAVSHDTYGGQNWGQVVSTSAINPTNWTRSYSRTGYLDPLPPRPNYDVLVNAQVTRLIFNSSSPADNLTASSVEYSPDGGATKTTVKVNKEVILAGGTIGSPTVLLYSGVGPKDVLSAAGIDVLSELPGVGQHLQDHVSASLEFGTTQQTAGDIFADNSTSEKTDPVFLSYVNDAVAFMNATTIFGNGVNALQINALSQMNEFASDSANSDATVTAGYQAIYKVVANTILNSPIAVIEILIGNNVRGAIRMGASLMHPFSHGQITLNSSDPLDYPVIDPGYLSHPTDVEILREALKLVRRLGKTAPLTDTLTNETWPGVEVQTDEEWETWLRGNIFTEYHPSSTCAMLPLNQSGVVNAKLQVYGLANVRVADASVPPIALSAHSMSHTYGLAEQASTIIRDFYNGKASKPHPKHNTTHGGGTNTPPSTNSQTNSTSSSNKKNAATYTTIHLWPIVLAIIACITAEMLILN